MQLTEIWRYPVKGLRGERLAAATLTPEAALPGDRRFAFAHDTSTFDPAAPCWQPKRQFLQLARDPGLSPLAAAWDEAAETLILEHQDGARIAAPPATEAGRDRLEGFLATSCIGRRRTGQRLVEAAPIIFSDTGQAWVSIIARASVRDLAERAGRTDLDAARFRGNLLIDGPAAWAELDWIGRAVAIGPVVLKVAEPIGRCAATTIDPTTGESDVDIPRLLVQTYGHNKCGLYAEVVTGGRVVPGDPVRVL